MFVRCYWLKLFLKLIIFIHLTNLGNAFILRSVFNTVQCTMYISIFDWTSKFWMNIEGKLEKVTLERKKSWNKVMWCRSHDVHCEHTKCSEESLNLPGITWTNLSVQKQSDTLEFAMRFRFKAYEILLTLTITTLEKPLESLNSTMFCMSSCHSMGPKHMLEVTYALGLLTMKCVLCCLLRWWISFFKWNYGTFHKRQKHST